MNREDYLEKLDSQNGYCNCPEVQQLYERRIKAGKLEARCNFMRANIDLKHPAPEDKQFLEAYNESSEELSSGVNSYQSLLTTSIGRSLRLILHNPRTFQAEKEISHDEAVKLSEDKEYIITIHCATCRQQIDVFA